MMKKTIRLTLIILSCITIQSCGFGYSVSQNFTPLKNTTATCDNPPQNVELFFEGEKIDFEYEKVGMIEVQGEQFSNDAELLEKIKTLSKSKCCDAIITLKKTYIDRERGLVFSSEPTQKYSAIVYHGLAVKKKAAIN
ncbi:hypothetical protein [Flavobacterium pedocola]